jgi:hypothetical protein
MRNFLLGSFTDVATILVNLSVPLLILWRRRGTGERLFTEARDRKKFFLSGVTLVMGCLLFSEGLVAQNTSEAVGKLAPASVLIVIAVIDLVGRLEIRSGGIVYGSSVVRWETIDSHEWNRRQDSYELVLHLKHRWVFHTVRYLITAAQKDKVESVLKISTSGSGVF